MTQLLMYNMTMHMLVLTRQTVVGEGEEQTERSEDKMITQSGARHHGSLRIAINVVLFSVIGCGQSLPSPIGGRDSTMVAPIVVEQRRSITTTPLVVRVTDPKQLSTVGSVLVLPPTYGNQLQVGTSLSISLSDAIEGIAERELNVTVMGKPWREASKDRNRLVAELSRNPTLLGFSSLGVDAVLRTEVGSFTERRGSSLGGEPASVSFVMTLVRTSDSAELWQASYSYGQTYLSENLLQLGDSLGSKRRGAGWSSGREIFEVGATSALQDLNARREIRFLGKVS